MAQYPCNTNGSQPVKKQWASPELVLIGTNTVNSGAHTGIHEKLVTFSKPTSSGSGNFFLYINPATHFLLSHTKNFYNS